MSEAVHRDWEPEEYSFVGNNSRMVISSILPCALITLVLYPLHLDHWMDGNLVKMETEVQIRDT
jgi:hypothetical protein